nr:hypothetical protein [Tanacetum cinerariifolium]
DEEEIAKIDVHDDTERGGDDDEESENNEESDDEETREEESFNHILRTPEDSEDDGNDEEDQGFKDGEDEWLNEEEEADELYQDVDINQGRGLQISQDIEDSHVTLTPVKPDGQQESSSMNEAVRVAVQIQTDRLHDSYQRENDEFLRTIDDNMKRIIKEQVKSQVKDQLSRILSRIKQSVNAQLESEVLTRSSHSSRTSYAVVVDLSEMELKKILIEKIEGNKSIQRSDEQRNLYKALVEAYEADKIILDTYGEHVILKRRCDDDDYQGEGPSAGSDRGSKRQRERKEPESARAPLEPATKSAGRSTTGFKSRQASVSKSAFAKEPVQTTSQIDVPSYPVFETGASSRKYTTSVTKMKAADYGNIKQTNLFAKAVSYISGIVQQYMNQQMNEVVRVAVQIQTDRLRDSYQRENDEFLRTIDDNMKRIIKEQVKSQVKDQVSRILPRIEQSVNAQLESEVLTRSSHSSRTSYVVAADLSEMELKKILIEKMEGNQSIQRSDEQRNLYKALVEADEADKIILDTYGEHVILKRRRDDDDDQGERPSVGSDRGSKRQREGKESESARALLKPATRSAGRSTTGSKSRQASTSESTFAEEPELAKQADSCSSFNELLDTPIDFSNFIMNQLGVNTLTPELLAGPTYELMKGSCKSLIELEYHLEEVYKAITYQLDWINPKDVYKEYRHPKACGRSSAGSRKLLEEAQPYQARHVPIRSKATISKYYVFEPKRIYLSKQGQEKQGIRMQYLPQTIWRKGDKDRAAAMIQAIDKMLKTRRIMRSLERFVGGRLYEGDFRMLQRTI